MERFVIEFDYNEKYNAGSKARDDIKDIMVQRGFKYILFKSKKISITSIFNIVYIMKKLNNEISEKSIVLIQLPILVSDIYLKPIIKILKNKKCKLIFLVHDVVSLRLQKNYKEVKKEINLFNKADWIISHNEVMSTWLLNNGTTSDIINLEIFDYLIDNFNESDKSNNSIPYSIAFAGNLDINKSGFIYKLRDNEFGKYKLFLYGLNYQQYSQEENIIYKGAFKPDELVNNINEDFGLIWDGNSLESCEGEFGEYTKYNNPHKLSLYISANIPVIVWENAAIARFVEENNIGIKVKSINEIEKKINEITIDQYNEMKKNVNRIRKQISVGYFTNKAIDNIERKIENYL